MVITHLVLFLSVGLVNTGKISYLCSEIKTCKLMKFGVVVFPGSNCDRDTLYVLRDVMGFETVTLWHKDRDLMGVDVVVIPGGFSYGDYLRSGALARYSPIMESVKSFVEISHGHVLGICNGFQVLCEAGMLPGALRPNRDRRFICKNIFLSPEVKNDLPTASLRGIRALRIPIAHGEGSYYASREVLTTMRNQNQILFRYCDENGNVRDSINPNGSIDNIAGICSADRRVIGMMPHPERASDAAQGNTDGLQILRSIISYWQHA